MLTRYLHLFSPYKGSLLRTPFTTFSSIKNWSSQQKGLNSRIQSSKPTKLSTPTSTSSTTPPQSSPPSLKSYQKLFQDSRRKSRIKESDLSLLKYYSFTNIFNTIDQIYHKYQQNSHNSIMISTQLFYYLRCNYESHPMNFIDMIGIIHKHMVNRADYQQSGVLRSGVVYRMMYCLKEIYLGGGMVEKLLRGFLVELLAVSMKNQQGRAQREQELVGQIQELRGRIKELDLQQEGFNKEQQHLNQRQQELNQQQQQLNNQQQQLRLQVTQLNHLDKRSTRFKQQHKLLQQQLQHLQTQQQNLNTSQQHLNSSQLQLNSSQQQHNIIQQQLQVSQQQLWKQQQQLNNGDILSQLDLCVLLEYFLSTGYYTEEVLRLSKDQLIRGDRHRDKDGDKDGDKDRDKDGDKDGKPVKRLQLLVYRLRILQSIQVYQSMATKSEQSTFQPLISPQKLSNLQQSLLSSYLSILQTQNMYLYPYLSLYQLIHEHFYDFLITDFLFLRTHTHGHGQPTQLMQTKQIYLRLFGEMSNVNKSGYSLAGNVTLCESMFTAILKLFTRQDYDTLYPFLVSFEKAMLFVGLKDSLSLESAIFKVYKQFQYRSNLFARYFWTQIQKQVDDLVSTEQNSLKMLIMSTQLFTMMQYFYLFKQPGYIHPNNETTSRVKLMYQKCYNQLYQAMKSKDIIFYHYLDGQLPSSRLLSIEHKFKRLQSTANEIKHQLRYNQSQADLLHEQYDIRSFCGKNGNHNKEVVLKGRERRNSVKYCQLASFIKLCNHVISEPTLEIVEPKFVNETVEIFFSKIVLGSSVFSLIKRSICFPNLFESLEQLYQYRFKDSTNNRFINQRDQQIYKLLSFFRSQIYQQLSKPLPSSPPSTPPSEHLTPELQGLINISGLFLYPQQLSLLDYSLTPSNKSAIVSKLSQESQCQKSVSSLRQKTQLQLIRYKKANPTSRAVIKPIRLPFLTAFIVENNQKLYAILFEIPETGGDTHKRQFRGNNWKDNYIKSTLHNAYETVVITNQPEIKRKLAPIFRIP